MGSNVLVNSCSFNSSNSSTAILPEETGRDILHLVLWGRIHGVLVSVVAIPANLIVIVCLWRDTNSRLSGFSTYAVSIAFTDLLVGVALTPVYVLRTYWTSWPLGLVGCILWRLLDYGLTSTSILLFLAMGYDRYRCVTAPLLYRSQFRRSRATRTSICMWIVGFLLWIPYILPKILVGNAQSFQARCSQFTFGVNALEITHVTIAYYIPMVILIVVNSILLLKLNKGIQIPRSNTSGTRRCRGQNQYAISAVSGVVELSTMPFIPETTTLSTDRKRSVTNEARPVTNSRNASSYKIVIMIVVFYSFWLPFCITWPLNGFCGSCIPDEVIVSLADLPYTQSAINPVIVVFTSHQIRTKIACAFRQIRQST